MDQCVLRVMGDEFKPIEFLAASRLSAYATFIKGKCSARRLKVAETSGLSCEVGRGSFLEQVEQAIAFLTRHRKDLRRIPTTTTIESCYLDFAYECRIDGSAVVVQRDCLPTELLLLSGELGIGICLSLAMPLKCLEEEPEGRQVP